MPLAAALVLLLSLFVALPARAAAELPWPAFETFVQRHVSADGRVIDPIDAHAYTTSEGQAYALFFALVAGDRPLFDRLLRWTRDNLAAGDLGQQLPAWRWGRLDDGRWGVADANAAADADLWLAWTLLEAGRLWNERGYRVLGKSLAARILREESADLPGLGLSLLPAPRGFVLTPTRWRLNPGYAPLPLLQGLAEADPEHRSAWLALLASSHRLVLGSARRGYAPDWVIYDAGTGFEADAETGSLASYDAIRVYLWASWADAERRPALLAALSGMAEPVPPPERVDLASGQRQGRGPTGFAAALIPYQRALGRDAAANQLRDQVTAAGWPLPGYYDSVLSLFGLGHDQGRYCFDSRGQLGQRRGETCVRRH